MSGMCSLHSNVQTMVELRRKDSISPGSSLTHPFYVIPTPTDFFIMHMLTTFVECLEKTGISDHAHSRPYAVLLYQPKTTVFGVFQPLLSAIRG